MSTLPVTAVVPGRNCAKTIRPCLEALLAIRDPAPLHEIIFVDDGSTDDTAAIVRSLPVTYLEGAGAGPGSARNLGWRAASTPLVWFVDADCVAEPDALALLLPHLTDDRVGGVSGSYGNLTSGSLLSCLIHEEIIERHRRMPEQVDHLATFNVIYRRAALEEVGGFDERYQKAQDAELAFRVMGAGYDLHFEGRSKVNHFHPTSLGRYLATQRQQGFWRVWLHLAHKGHATRGSYSGFFDHIQPPLAVLSVLALPLVWVPGWRWLPLIPLVLLVLATLPMTARLVLRLRQARYLLYADLSVIRAFWRGAGMVQGMFDVLRSRGTSRGAGAASQPD